MSSITKASRSFSSLTTPRSRHERRARSRCSTADWSNRKDRPMPLREVLALAVEAMRANKLRAVLTMLGMIIGVGAVVLLVSIGNGAKNYITGQFEGMGSNILLVQPGRTDTRS